MENDTAIVPSKKWETEIDYRYCIICQQDLANGKAVTTTKPESIETIFKFTSERHQYGDTSVT